MPSSFWSSFLCLLFGHRPVRGAVTFATATLQVHLLDGRVVERPADLRSFPVTCARCGALLRTDIVIDREGGC